MGRCNKGRLWTLSPALGGWTTTVVYEKIRDRGSRSGWWLSVTNDAAVVQKLELGERRIVESDREMYEGVFADLKR